MAGKKNCIRSVEVQETIVDRICTLIARRAHKSVIKKMLLDEYKISWRQAENFITRARAAMVRLTSKTKAEHLEDAIQFYDSVIADPHLLPRDRLRAQKYMADLLGLGDHDLAALEARLAEARRLVEEARNVAKSIAST